MGKSATPRAALRKVANREVYRKQMKVAAARRRRALAAK